MANRVLLKRSSTAGKIPLTTDLQLGELAVNTTDGKLYLKKNNGTDSIVTLGAGGSLLLPAIKSAIPNRTLYRRVMASPPTTSFYSGSTTLPSPRLWPSILATGSATTFQLGGQYFTYTRAGGVAKQGTSSFDELFVTFNSVNYGDHTSDNGYTVSVMHEGASIEFDVRGIGGGYFMCKVDDEYISLTPTSIPANGAENFYRLTFSTTKMRRIDFMATAAPFAGVYTAATDTVYPAPVRGPRCIIMGDSFTEGTGATGAGLTDYLACFAASMGWDDVWGSGVGSTGYLAAPAPKVKYRDRVAADVIAYAPDIVMLTGGYNDSASTAAAIGTEAGLLVDQLKSGLPNSLIVMVAPWWNKGAAGMSKLILDQTAALKSVASAKGCLWLSLTEIEMLNGVTLQNTTLTSAVSANATTVFVAAPLATNSTYKFPDGTRFMVKAITGTGPYQVTTDGPLQTAQSNGAVLTQVGGSLWQGTGYVGATSGWGNCDRYVSSDSVHPAQAGHEAMGQALAAALISALKKIG